MRVFLVFFVLQFDGCVMDVVEEVVAGAWFVGEECPDGGLVV